jgi:transposase
MNISDTFFFMSSIEAPKLQRPPGTFVPSMEKTLLLKEQPKNGLRFASKAILTRVALRARGGICWDMEGISHYELLERNLTVTSESHCQQLRRLEKEIQQKRTGRRYGVILQHDNARPHTANMTEAAIQELDWEILPHPPYSPHLAPSDYHLFRSLSNNRRGDFFKNDALELQHWLDEFFMAKPEDFFKRGTENVPERWEAVVNNGGEYIIN